MSDLVKEAREFIPAWSDGQIKSTLDRLADALEVAESKLARIGEAMSGHPKCDVHDDDGPVTCGWKRAYESVQRAMEGEPTDDD